MILIREALGGLSHLSIVRAPLFFPSDNFVGKTVSKISEHERFEWTFSSFNGRGKLPPNAIMRLK